MKISITGFLFTLCCMVFGQNHKINVEIINVKNNNGNLMVAIYSGAENFLKKRFDSRTVEIKGQKGVVAFENIPAGEYAVSVYHDENENKKLDTGWFGIPKEGYGNSNNPKVRMGPPKYEDAKFQLSKNISFTIKLNN